MVLSGNFNWLRCKENFGEEGEFGENWQVSSVLPLVLPLFG